ncbi:MAG: hypothetical protein M9926_13155 [Lentimicrobium sp.]|uniref:hypothetical protein n=1 Tax=Lentimicrobium sp. TaxID=2034841 RepID=UPI0025D64FA4|nr:hypothetical protein [Lentimicrobium sp.]MCO5257693.1 hypothetical protein [Lentimicrobium sp.]
MQKVTLYFLERPDIKINIELYFNGSGQLILDGYDIGKSVKYFGAIRIMNTPSPLSQRR